MRYPVTLAARRLLPGLAVVEDLDPPPGGSYGLGGPEDQPIVRSAETPETRDLDEVLDLRHETHAHAAAYAASVDGRILERLPRLRKAALGSVRAAGAELTCATAWVDVDLHQVLRAEGKVPWGDLTRDQETEVRGLLRAARRVLADRGFPAYAAYATRHGLRFVHVLTKPVPAGAPYEMLLGRVHAAYQLVGLPADRACRDWTRLYGCPQVTYEDGTASWEQPWYGLQRWADGEVQPAEAELVVPDTSALVVPAGRVGRAGRPSAEQVRDLLETYDPETKKWRPTQAGRKLRDVVRNEGCPWWETISGGRVVAPRGSRHDSLLAMVGSVVSLAHGREWASAELVYALLAPCVEALGEDEDWAGKAWEQVTSCWNKEGAKKAARAASASVAVEVRAEEAVASDFVAGVRSWLPAARQVADAEVAELVVRNRLAIVAPAAKKVYHVLRRDGYYGASACVEDHLPLAVRDLGMEWLVPVERQVEDKQGNLQAQLVSGEALRDRYASTYAATRVRLGTGLRGSHLSRDEYGAPVLDLVPFYLRDDVPKVRHAHVEELWRRAFRADYEEAVMAHLALLLFEHGPTAAVAQVGVKDSGKSLFALAAKRLISTRRLVPASALVQKHNAALLWSPIVYVDEAMDRGHGYVDASAALRRLVTGGDLTLEPKYQDQVHVAGGTHRVYLAANSPEAVTSILSERPRSADDWAALGERLVVYRPHEDASRYFAEIGGRTGMADWLPEDEAVPGHYAEWLSWALRHVYPWDGDQPRRHGTRLLVAGSARSWLLDQADLASGATCSLVMTVNKLLKTREKVVEIDGATLWVQANAVIARAERDTRERRSELWAALRSMQEGAPAHRAGQTWTGLSLDRVRRLIGLYETPAG